jgi:glucokinase
LTVLAADVGGTSVRVARVDATAVLERHEEPTGDDPRQLVSMLAALGGADAAVVGLPGRIDHVGGRMLWGPNLHEDWSDGLREAEVAQALGLPVHFANDADLAAVGETYHGAGRGYEDVVYITISTGFGAGAVLGRKLVRGRWSVAEVGHTLLDLNTLETPEDLASGSALARLAGRPGPEVVQRAAAGDVEAEAVLGRVVHAGAVAAVNLAHLFSPQVVVVGGGLGMVGDRVLGPMRALMAERGPRELDVTIVNAECGDDAGLRGAASWREATSSERAAAPGSS